MCIPVGTAFDCSCPCREGSSTLLLGPVTFPLLKSPVSSLCKVMWNGPSLTIEASSLSLLSSVHHTYLLSYISKEFAAISRHQHMYVWHRCTSHNLLLYHRQNRILSRITSGLAPVDRTTLSGNPNTELQSIFGATGDPGGFTWLIIAHLINVLFTIPNHVF